MTKTIHLLSFLAIAAILVGSLSTGTMAFADEDDDGDDKKADKKWKKSDNKKRNVVTGDGAPLDNKGKIGMLYVDRDTDDLQIYEKTDKKEWTLLGAILGGVDSSILQTLEDIQNQLDTLSFVQNDPNESVLEIQVDPASTEPAIEVSDGTNTLFTVNNDGSIKIGSNTVIINPDGTITGSPLNIPVGSSIGGDTIATATDISNIALTPGPAGADGAPGPTGDIGSSGLDGINAIINRQSIPVGSTSCPAGGTSFDIGTDLNRNGVLDKNERQTHHVCNGEEGPIGPSGEDGIPGANGQDGLPGFDGQDGTKIFNDNGPPTNSLGQNLDDLYLDGLTGDVFKWSIDDTYPQYSSIEQAVDFHDSEKPQKVYGFCGPGTKLIDGVCTVVKTVEPTP